MLRTRTVLLSDHTQMKLLYDDMYDYKSVHIPKYIRGSNY